MNFEKLRRLMSRWGSVCVVSVAACGGGGGGDSPAAGFRVQLDRSAVQITYEESQFAPPAQVRASWTGQPPASVYIGAVVEGDGIDPNIAVTLSGTYADIALSPRGGLTAGTYTGRVLALVCADSACSQRIGGTPLPIAYTVTVTPGMRATPNPVSLSAVSGSGASAQLSVRLPTGAVSFQSSVANASPWLQLGTPSGNTLPVNARSWRVGAYDTTLELLASNGQLLYVPVHYEVTAPPGGEHDLGLSPASLTFSAVENTAAPAQMLTLATPTWDSRDPVVGIEYAGARSGWLSVVRSGAGYQVLASAAQLPQGAYTAVLTFTPDTPATRVQVPVSLTVGAGLVQPAARVVTVGAEATAGTLADSVPVQLAGGAAVAWTAASSASWLGVQGSGTTGGSLAFQIDAAGLNALPNFGDHVATVRITPGPSTMTPVDFTVTVRKRLPEVSGVGPSLLVSGRSSRLVVRGRGFDSIGNLAARLQTGGLPVSGLTRVDDGTIVLQASPTAAGDLRVSVSNGLGLDPAGATLQVVAPQAYSYAAVPTSGRKRSIVFDAKRRAVYAVTAVASRLDRFSFNGSTWSADSVPVPSLLDTGLSPDGQSLMVTSTTGHLQLLDPTTLATQFSLDHPNGFAYNLDLGQSIPSTSNGRSWLVVGSGWNELMYFDHATRTLRPRAAQPDLETTFYSGPLLWASRDGERLVVMQSGAASSAPPTLVMNTSDSLLQPNPAGFTNFYEAQLSEDGSRMVLERQYLFDGNFNRLGQASIAASTGYFAVAATIAPDGRRVYLLAYPEAALNSFPTTLVPRVYVFDATSISAGELAQVGQFDLAHYPTCRDRDGDCRWLPRPAISPDGATLFFVGDANLVVAPIPEALRSPSAAQRSPALKRWDLGTAAH